MQSWANFICNLCVHLLNSREEPFILCLSRSSRDIAIGYSRHSCSRPGDPHFLWPWRGSSVRPSPSAHPSGWTGSVRSGARQPRGGNERTTPGSLLRIHRAGGPGGQRGGLGSLRGGHGITIHFLGFTINVAGDRLGVLFTSLHRCRSRNLVNFAKV